MQTGTTITLILSSTASVKTTTATGVTRQSNLFGLMTPDTGTASGTHPKNHSAPTAKRTLTCGWRKQMFEKALENALLRKVDAELATDLMQLHAAVCRQIQCECGRVMDSRKSVLVKALNTVSICCGDCWDARVKGYSAEHVARINAVDSRLYKTDGTPRAKRRKKKTAFIRTKKGLQPVEYSRKVTLRGAVFFLHGRREDWTLTEWGSGYRVSFGDTQQDTLDRFASVPDGKWESAKTMIAELVAKNGKANS